MALRYTLKNLDKAREQAIELQEKVKDNFSNEKLYKLFIDSIIGFDSSYLEPEEEVVLEFE